MGGCFTLFLPERTSANECDWPNYVAPSLATGERRSQHKGWKPAIKPTDQKRDMHLKPYTAMYLTLLLALPLAPFTSHGRWMNPQTGRFWTMDTFEGNQEDPQSLHKYLYCRSNPANHRDPSGHETLVGLSIANGIAVGLDAMYNSTVMAAGFVAMDSLAALAFGMTVEDMLPGLNEYVSVEDGFSYQFSIHGFGGQELLSGGVNVVSGEQPFSYVATLGKASTKQKSTSEQFVSNVSKGGEQGRDAMGRFISKLPGQSPPGSSAENQFAAFMEANGFTVVRNVSVRTPFSPDKRTYEVGIVDPATGEIDAYEVKSTRSAMERRDPPARAQFSSDRYVNMKGRVDAIGAHKGKIVRSATKLGWGWSYR